MNKIKISYVITTYNKINSLKIILNDLVSKINYVDEELIIIDGGSEDGTDLFLKKLKDEKKIDKLVIENDFGEAHGFNKGILLSEGSYIKIMTDDDIYNLNSVRDSVTFMDNNKNIDLLFSNGISLKTINHELHFHLHTYNEALEKWKKNKKSFSFCGLGLLLRRSSLPLIGLFNNCFVRVDAEYSFRNTKNGANLALLTTPSWVRVESGLSNSVKFKKRLIEEEIILNWTYLNTFSIKFRTRIILSKIFHFFFRKTSKSSPQNNFEELFNCSKDFLKEYDNSPIYLQ